MTSGRRDHSKLGQVGHTAEKNATTLERQVFRKVIGLVVPDASHLIADEVTQITCDW